MYAALPCGCGSSLCCVARVHQCGL